jgi:hypothetical protein
LLGLEAIVPANRGEIGNRGIWLKRGERGIENGSPNSTVSSRNRGALDAFSDFAGVASEMVTIAVR